MIFNIYKHIDNLSHNVLSTRSRLSSSGVEFSYVMFASAITDMKNLKQVTILMMCKTVCSIFVDDPTKLWKSSNGKTKPVIVKLPMTCLQPCKSVMYVLHKEAERHSRCNLSWHQRWWHRPYGFRKPFLGWNPNHVSEIWHICRDRLWWW